MNGVMALCRKKKKKCLEKQTVMNSCYTQEFVRKLMLLAVPVHSKHFDYSKLLWKRSVHNDITV